MKPFSDSIIRHYVISLYVLLRTLWYHNVDINLFLTYTYGSTAFPREKTILYCDETYYQANERAKHQGLSLGRGKTRIHSEDKTLRKAKCLFSTIPATIQHFQDNGFLNTYFKSINMIHITFNNSVKYYQTNTNKDHYELLFIGRKKYERGVDILLEAYAKLLPLIDMPVYLNIVGFSQTEFPEVADLPGNINFYKYLNKSNKTDYAIYTKLLSEASLFVIPQRGTLLAGAMFEALYYATPVITTDVEGMNRFITNGVNGVLIKKADSVMFAEAIADVLNDSDRLCRMSFNAMKSVEDMTPKRAMKELLYASLDAIYGRHGLNE